MSRAQCQPETIYARFYPRTSGAAVEGMFALWAQDLFWNDSYKWFQFWNHTRLVQGIFFRKNAVGQPTTLSCFCKERDSHAHSSNLREQKLCFQVRLKVQTPQFTARSMLWLHQENCLYVRSRDKAVFVWQKAVRPEIMSKNGSIRQKACGLKQYSWKKVEEKLDAVEDFEV